jgi:hypothetical protein
MPLNKRNFAQTGLNNVEQMQQDQDGDWHPNQPETNCATHFRLLFVVLKRLSKQTPPAPLMFRTSGYGGCKLLFYYNI